MAWPFATNMLRLLGLFLLWLSLCTFPMVAFGTDFDRDIAPLLATYCLDCHGSVQPKGQLALDRKESAWRGGESGKAIVPNDLSQSLMWEKIASGEMPPKAKMAEREKDAIRNWILDGAKWGTDPIDPHRFTTEHRAGYDWWALQPIKPFQKDEIATASQRVDAWMDEKRKEQMLTRSPETDRMTLVRRVALDLTGLVPTYDEIMRFGRNPSEESYREMVEYYLASPRYGERWARHWLDLARFGESDGFEYDRMRPNAWPYRDWVIQALNADMPYDQFAQWQIAGDVLAPNSVDATIASGFLIHGAHDGLLPAGEVMKQIMRQDELEDIVGTVGQTFLGLTIHCARCHDHKFDPIRMEDYYRIASALAGVRRGDRTMEVEPEDKGIANRIAELRTSIQNRWDEAGKRIQNSDANLPSIVPIVAWDFDRDANDDSGKILGKLQGGATIEDGKLQLLGDQSYLETAPIPYGLKAKTLEVWATLKDVEQRGGAPLSLQKQDGSLFDAIVYGEREPKQWMAGSNNFQRTESFHGPEESDANKPVHIVFVYEETGRIRGYRNGVAYGSSYPSQGPVVFEAGSYRALIGLRHAPAGGNRHWKGTIDRAALYDRALMPDEVRSLFAFPQAGSRSRRLAMLSESERGRMEYEEKELGRLEDVWRQMTRRTMYTVKPAQPEKPTHVLLRGNPLQLGSVVKPGGLQSVSKLPHEFGLEADAPEAERRVKLAQWITHRANPLFARTMVNRVWHYHFGKGIIETPSDLGRNGGYPNHPEVLEYLSSQFQQHGWSLKSLHRMMLHTKTYRQSSLPRDEAIAKDRGNRWLWRFSPHRLEAESVRDSILSIAGVLNLEMGGPSFQDFRPFMNHNSQYYEPLDLEEVKVHRRSIYRMWARGGKSPLLDTLDCPDPSTSTPNRGSTTTPLQALAMLNNAFMLRMSQQMSERLEKELPAKPTQQIQRAFLLTSGHVPTQEELRQSEAFVKQAGMPAFCRVLLNSNGFLYVD